MHPTDKNGKELLVGDTVKVSDQFDFSWQPNGGKFFVILDVKNGQDRYGDPYIFIKLYNHWEDFDPRDFIFACRRNTWEER